MKIYAFGDSHAGKFGADPRFILVGPPAPTAYGLASEHSRSESILLLRAMLVDVEPDDVILFVLGEIDCRIHVHRQHIETGKSYQRICRETVDRYGHIVRSVRDDNNVKVAVLSVPPAVAQGNEYGYEHYGTRDQRAEIAEAFNVELFEWCRDSGVPFVDLYSQVADERGWLKDEYAVWDGAHLHENTVPMVLRELAIWFPEAGL